MSELYSVGTLQEALDLLAARDHLVIAGGTDVFPAESHRVAWGARPLQATDTPILDLQRVDALRGFKATDVGLEIGALTTWTQLLESSLPCGFSALKAAAKEVGGQQIQNRGTLVGNICNASPAADGIPVLMALDASVRLARAGGTRELPVRSFVLGNRETAIESGELVTHVIVPHSSLEAPSRFEKLGSRRYLVISIVMVAVSVRFDEEGACVSRARVVVGACGPRAVHLTDLEQRLVGVPRDDLAAHVHSTDFTALAPMSDIRADSGYRLHAARVLTERALRGLSS